MSTSNTNTDARSNGNWQGMNWIRQTKRLAIYLRDGMACTYCGATLEDGAQLSLDHLTPHSKGGSNNASNLVTCCSKCNSSRGTRSVAAFARGVSAYTEEAAVEITKRVRRNSSRKLAQYLVDAKNIENNR